MTLDSKLQIRKVATITSTLVSLFIMVWILCHIMTPSPTWLLPVALVNMLTLFIVRHFTK